MNISFFDCRRFNEPWYMQDETAELEFLRRHKSFISEIKKSVSAKRWIQNCTVKGFESERDGYLCLSRHPLKLGLGTECNGCDSS